MNQNNSTIFRNFLLKGLLVSVIVFIVANLLNSLNLTLWYMNYEKEVPQLQWVLIGLLGGFFPVITYIVLGIFRCIKVIYKDVYQYYIQPLITEVADFSSNKIDGELKISESIKNELPQTMYRSIIDGIDEKLAPFPSWVKSPINWLLSKVSLEHELISFINKLDDLSKGELSTKISTWLENRFESLIDDVKPFWVKLLVPLHIVFGVCIWFISF